MDNHDENEYDINCSNSPINPEEAWARSRPKKSRIFAKRQISTLTANANRNIHDPEDGSDESMTTSEEHELEDMDDTSEGGSEIDEETGLTGKERKKYHKRKRRRASLSTRVANTATIDLTKSEKKEADKYVIRSLLTNAVLICLWYLFSLSITMYNKWMFSDDHLHFPFPLFTTSIHMIVQFTLASLVLIVFPSLRPRAPPQPIFESDPSLTQLSRPTVTWTFYLTRLLPCGVATSLDIGLGNASFRFIEITFYTMCKSSVLGFVLLFAFLFRLEKPTWQLLTIIAAMTAGVVMMVAGEAAFNVTGFALIMSASFFSGFRWSLTQILLLKHHATHNPFADDVLPCTDYVHHAVRDCVWSRRDEGLGCWIWDAD